MRRSDFIAPCASIKGAPWLNCWTAWCGAYCGGAIYACNPIYFARSAEKSAVELFGLHSSSCLSGIKACLCAHLTIMQVHREFELRAAADLRRNSPQTSAPGGVQMNAMRREAVLQASYAQQQQQQQQQYAPPLAGYPQQQQDFMPPPPPKSYYAPARHQ